MLRGVFCLVVLSLVFASGAWAGERDWIGSVHVGSAEILDDVAFLDWQLGSGLPYNFQPPAVGEQSLYLFQAQLRAFLDSERSALPAAGLNDAYEITLVAQVEELFTEVAFADVSGDGVDDSMLVTMRPIGGKMYILLDDFSNGVPAHTASGQGFGDGQIIAELEIVEGVGTFAQRAESTDGEGVTSMIAKVLWYDDSFFTAGIGKVKRKGKGKGKDEIRYVRFDSVHVAPAAPVETTAFFNDANGIFPAIPVHYPPLLQRVKVFSQFWTTAPVRLGEDGD